PDILCNGGGVIVSHLEMVQNFDLWQRGQSDVNRLLDQKIGFCLECRPENGAATQDQHEAGGMRSGRAKGGGGHEIEGMGVN
ncbi:MAG: hypothetical protein HGB17_13220, partial [Syntrophobacteraceae bacterium]|nr:hypothetical protein [Syntrophobacteraceae bacterium]